MFDSFLTTYLLYSTQDLGQIVCEVHGVSSRSLVDSWWNYWRIPAEIFGELLMRDLIEKKNHWPARFEPGTLSMIFPPLIRLKLGSVPRPPTPPTAHRIRGVWGCLVERETHFASAFCCPLLDPVGSRRRIMILISLCVFIWNTLLLATQKHIKSFFFSFCFCTTLSECSVWTLDFGQGCSYWHSGFWIEGLLRNGGGLMEGRGRWKRIFSFRKTHKGKADCGFWKLS